MKRTLLSSNPVYLQSSDVHRLISEQSSHLLCDAKDGDSCDQHTVSNIVVKASVTKTAVEGTYKLGRCSKWMTTVRTYLIDDCPSVLFKPSRSGRSMIQNFHLLNLSLTYRLRLLIIQGYYIRTLPNWLRLNRAGLLQV